MKHIKKCLALMLTLAMVMAMGITAFAAEDNHTITINNSVNGTTYSAYEMLNVVVDDHTTPTAYSYTVNEAWENFFYVDKDADPLVLSNAVKDVFELNNAGYIVAKTGVTNNAADLKTFASAAKEYAEDNNLTADATATAGENKTATLNTHDGYYLIVSSLGSNLMIDTTPGNATINEKNGVPDVDKKIIDGDERVNVSEAKVGDSVPYEVTVTVKPGTTSYVVTDTFSAGLTYNSDLNVKVDAVDVDAKNYKAELSENGRTLTITFDDDYIASLQVDEDGAAAEATIVLTYSATINDDAQMEVAGNPNAVQLAYNNGSNQTSQEKTVTTYTWGFDIFKKNAQGQPLANAKFNLKDSENNTLYFKSATEDGHTVYTYAGTTEGTGLTSELVTPESGYIYIKGLDSGEYTLTETEAPAGYNKLAEDIVVTVTGSTEDGTVTITAAQGETTMSVDTHENHKYSTADGAADVAKIEILNNTGAELPSTGGIGTTIFYVLGGILVVGAGVVLITRKRMGAQK